MAIANITNNILTDSGTLISSLATSATTISTTSPLQGGGDLSANRTLSITQSGTASNGYLSSTDWNTFNGKGSGTVTSVAALTIGTTGTDLSSTVANSTTTPVITLNVPTASATNRGVLSSADWTTFNNKQSALTNPVTGTGTTNYLPKFTGTSTIGNSALQDDGSTVTITSLTKNVGEFRIYPSSGTAVLRFGSGSTEKGKLSVDTSSNMIFETGGYERMRLDASGNLGLGVTPSAWNSNYKAINIGNAGFIYSRTVSDQTSIGTNWYRDGAGAYLYQSNGYATYFEQSSGTHAWYTAPSGTAGNAISFTQAMTLTASGRLLINTPTESTYQLDVNGTGRFSGETFLNGRVHGVEMGVERNGSDTVAAGPWFRWTNAATDRQMLTQLNASNGLTTWSYNGTAWASVYTLSQTGAATFSSSVTATSFFESSDSRLKTLIQDNYQTKGIGQITPKLYTKNGKVELGYYAQDFVGVLDSAVSTGSDDMLSLSYREVHTAKIYALEQEIKELKAKMK